VTACFVGEGACLAHSSIWLSGSSGASHGSHRAMPTLYLRKRSTRPAAHVPEHASAVLILVMVWVPTVMGTRTGSIGQLSAARLAVVAAAAGPGAYLLPAVCQHEPDLGGEWRVVGVEVGEEDVPT
jgi:hypothetical protein